MAANDEIMRALGRLEEGVARLRADFTDEKEHSAESRGRMHQKLEKIEEDVGIVGKVAAQARDKADATESVLTGDVKPVTDEIKRMKLMGIGALAVVGLAAGWLGASAAQIIEALRAWLRQ